MKLLPGDHVAQSDLPIGWHGYCRCMIGADTEWYQCVVISETNVAVLIGSSWTIKSKTINKLEFRPPQSEAYINGWHERGEIPPVGAKCLMIHVVSGVPQDDGIEVEITYQGNGVGCYKSINNGHEATFNQHRYQFRPLRTPKEKTIEAVCDELKHLLTVPCTAEHNKLIAEHLYKAGLLKEVE